MAQGRSQRRLARQLRDLQYAIDVGDDVFSPMMKRIARRPSVAFRKVINGFRSVWGADLFAAVQSVIDTGRHQDLTPFQAIRNCRDPLSVLIAA